MTIPLAIEAVAVLLEEDASRRIELDRERNQQHQRRGDDEQAATRTRCR